MPAHAKRPLPSPPLRPDREAAPAFSRDDEPELDLRFAGEAAASPALQLQNMLFEHFSVAEETVGKTDKYDVRVRIACIVGISAGGWGLVILATMGLINLIRG